MRSIEEMAGGEMKAAKIHNDDAVAGRACGAAKAVLDRGIEDLLPNLRRYARSLTRDLAAGDDLVQECIARALAKLHLWTAGTDLRAWLFTIMHNQYVSQVRRASREGTIVKWSDCSPALTCTPRQIAQLELRDLERAITLLPEEQRIAVLLVSLTGKTYDEIASDCDVPVGTIRSRLSRGRRTLRKLTGVAPAQQRFAAVCQTSGKSPTGAKLSDLPRAYPSMR